MSMIIAESKLKQLVYEEVMLRVIDDLVDEELFKFCLENKLLKEDLNDDVSDEEYLTQWKKDDSFRQKVKNALAGFSLMPTRQRIAAIVAMGVLGAAGVQFAGDWAERSQASAIAKEFRLKAKEAKAEYTVDWKELSNFRDAAIASAEASPIKITDAAGIDAAKEKFTKQMGVEEAPIIADGAVGIQTGTQTFLYTPADQIPDNEVLPFVAMSKADWEKVVRTWLQDEGGQDRLKAWTGAGDAKATSAFWEYSEAGGYALDIDPETGERGMWLPPEWSVAYDVLQKNVSRAGLKKAPANPLTIPMDQGDQWLEEIMKKSLHEILNVL